MSWSPRIPWWTPKAEVDPIIIVVERRYNGLKAFLANGGGHTSDLAFARRFDRETAQLLCCENMCLLPVRLSLLEHKSSQVVHGYENFPRASLTSDK